MQDTGLILMRHAKSDWDARYDRDFERPLSKRGRKNAKQVGNWLRRQGLGSLCLVSSPAERARRTAETVADRQEPGSCVIHFERNLYEAGLSQILAIIEQYRSISPTLLLVAHNPGLDEVYEYLDRDPVAYRPDGKLLTTAALAILRFDTGEISVEANSARTEVLRRPRDLEN